MIQWRSSWYKLKNQAKQTCSKPRVQVTGKAEASPNWLRVRGIISFKCRMKVAECFTSVEPGKLRGPPPSTIIPWAKVRRTKQLTGARMCLECHSCVSVILQCGCQVRSVTVALCLVRNSSFLIFWTLQKKQTQLVDLSWPNLHVFGLWEKTRVPRGNPHGRRKRANSTQKVDPGMNPTTQWFQLYLDVEPWRTMDYWD